MKSNRNSAYQANSVLKGEHTHIDKKKGRHITVRTHKDVLKNALSDAEVRREYEELEPEYDLRHALLRLRQEMNLTQRELAERMGTKQEYISRIERGHTDLTWSYLARLVHALGADIDISFRPRESREPVKTRLVIR